MLLTVGVRNDDGPTADENCLFCNGSIISPSTVPPVQLASYYKVNLLNPEGALGPVRRRLYGDISELDRRDELAFTEAQAKQECAVDAAKAADTAKAEVSQGFAKKARRTMPVQNPRCKGGYVPSLLTNQTLDVRRGWRSFRRGGSPPFFVPCSSARGEDAAVLRSFFSHARTGAPLHGGSFLEIGGVDGMRESNTWVYELCLGWRGVVVEGHPSFFKQLVANRPRALTMRAAACSSAGWVKYSRVAQTYAAVAGVPGRHVGDTIEVECVSLGTTLVSLGVAKLDFVSVDVEGTCSELRVLESLVEARGL